MSLQDFAKKVFQWFPDNQMKRNTDKCHLLLSKNDNTQLEIGDSLIKNCNSETFLDVKIDNKLSFHEHLKNIC